MCWDAARSPDLASTSKAPSHSGMEQWLCFLVRFTVTGIARKSHPIPMALARRAFCADTPAIHLWPYYNRFARPRQFGFTKSAPFAPPADA